MSRSEKKRARRLRWRLMQSLTVTFVLLWLGTMVLFTSNTCSDMESGAKTAARAAQTSVDEHYEFYTNNIASGLGEQANHILSGNLSSLSLGQVSEMHGGMAFVVRTLYGYERSQLSWGWGNQEGTDLGQRWYFSFDEGLDDQGQIALANWIIANRDGWDYTIYPDEYRNSNTGSFARVTGVERPGYEIAVQKIEIIHPDGTTQTMVETSTEGESKTWDFAYLRVCSVLLPSWSSNGKDGPVNMERRLASYREAHVVLDREIAGEKRAVQSPNGFAIGTTDPDGVVNYIAVECDVLPAALKQDAGLYISTALLTLIVLLFLSAKLSKQITVPVETLCREVEEGKCSEDGPIQELNVLASAFNDAQKKLEGQLEREREFTRSAAHELKTPLAILRAHAECAREDVVPEKRDSYLDIVLKESDQMADLVSSLLELARLESGLSLNLESVALAPLIKEVWESMALSLEQKKIVLSMTLEDLWIEGDKGHLNKLVRNLATNALRHTPEGGTITVSLSEQDGQAILVVDNDGQQIPDADLPRLWDPFYRVDKARNRSDGGTGLGLTIVRAAILAHGGTCEVENRSGGVRFRVSLPCGK